MSDNNSQKAALSTPAARMLAVEACTVCGKGEGFYQHAPFDESHHEFAHPPAADSEEPTWPDWASSLLAIIREYTGPCPEDAYEGVDLPEELRTWFDGYRDELIGTGKLARIDPPAAEPVGLREAAEMLCLQEADLEAAEARKLPARTVGYIQCKAAEGKSRMLASAIRALATPARTDDAGVGGDDLEMARDAAARYFENDPLDKARKAIAASIRQGGTMDYQDATQVALYGIRAARRAALQQGGSGE